MDMKFTLPIASITHDANALTVAQIVAPTNQRVRINGIKIFGLGSTGASVQHQWILEQQADAGTSAAAEGDFVKDPPGFSESIQTTARKTFSAEPASTKIVDDLCIHQQSSFLWIPERAIILNGGERYGLVYLAGQAGGAAKYRFLLEE